MLSKKKITDKEKIFKCACLAVTAAVLVRTSHVTKIVPEHVELIRDIKVFLAYPWGRVGFDLLVSSIKSKDELELSQKTIAVKGFFYAIQLVMMAAIPTLTEVLQEPSGDSDSDGEEKSDGRDEPPSDQDANMGSDDFVVGAGEIAAGQVKMMLSPSHARDINEEAKVFVHSIIPVNEEYAIESMDLRWADEEMDGAVDVTVKIIGEGFTFTKDMFTGGLTSVDLLHMRSEKMFNTQPSAPNRRSHVHSDLDNQPISMEAGLEAGNTAPSQPLPSPAPQQPAPSFNPISKAPGLTMSKEEFIRNLTQSINAQGTESSCFSGSFSAIPKSGSHPNPATFATTLPVGSQPIPEMDLLLSVSPTFFLGLTQENQSVDHEPDYLNAAFPDDPVQLQRKSKRLKTSYVVYKDYHCGVTRTNPSKTVFSMLCDPKANYGSWFTDLKAKLSLDRRPMKVYEGSSVDSEDVIDIGERTRVLPPKVVDAVMYYIRHISGPQMYPMNYNKIEFFNTIFPVLIKNHYVKFTKTAVKDRSKFKFQPSLMSYFEPENPLHPLPEFMYFPFNFDKRHWVGVCVNIPSGTIFVLDSNVVFRSDSALKKDFAPICNMFPFLVRAASTKALRDEKPYSLERVLGIPQNEGNTDSAVSAMLLLQAHATAGIEGCKTISPEVVASESLKLAVMFYDEFGPTS
ncbi:hypothetical protein EUTSA_v10003372mg [Eutrema salsugineum]|uniref:Ubiquitin-like protease family profile domain-containing protein n=1 Tax=Eutrema salsugineum TaxID=72664 RepID=V4LQ69_EUTSA|nr:hypothetical protein EUTSA_v10003372mg [Eutrema salsugineum]